MKLMIMALTMLGRPVVFGAIAEMAVWRPNRARQIVGSPSRCLFGSFKPGPRLRSMSRVQRVFSRGLRRESANLNAAED